MVNEPIDNRDQIIADFRQQLAEARAEVERVTLQKEIIKRWHTRNEEEADEKLAAQAADNATLRERLAAEVVDVVTRISEKAVQRYSNGAVIFRKDLAKEIITTWLAAGWIPPSTKGEG